MEHTIIEILKYIIDKIPASMLTVIIISGALIWAHKNEKIPLKIQWGNQKNGKTIVTKEMLKINCEERQRELNVNLKEIKDGISNVQQRMSFLEGKTSVRHRP
jgi:hypothetical protein